MGGSGSGRRSSYDAKQTVEDCLDLDVNKLARDGMIRRTPWQGSLIWTNTRTGEQIASVGYTCTGSGDDWTLTLNYTVTRRDGEKHDVRLPIPLQTTVPCFGGERWWFTCPLVVRGRSCLRRVGKLYPPPGGLYFGCRRCYDLAYTTCQESHKHDRLFRSIAGVVGCTPEMVKGFFRDRW
ncbi:MAG: hypothetical protein HYX78_03190 [Armatimonadetes bacterium]|nr:hypothetical protein [Armatimonadota bacterium]